MVNDKGPLLWWEHSYIHHPSFHWENIHYALQKKKKDKQSAIRCQDKILHFFCTQVFADCSRMQTSYFIPSDHNFNDLWQIFRKLKTSTDIANFLLCTRQYSIARWNVLPFVWKAHFVQILEAHYWNIVVFKELTGNPSYPA